MKVMYYSRSGNTKKIADAIAQSLNETAEAVPPAYPLENVKLLFLGSGLYAGKIDNKMRNFINTLNISRVKNVALFSTSGGQDTAIREMKSLLEQKGINVIDQSFICKGKSFIFIARKHPSREDLKDAQNFARSVIEKMSL